MDAERLLAIADLLDDVPYAEIKWPRPEYRMATLPNGKHVAFNMSAWAQQEACGTICCIAGLTALLFGDPEEDPRGQASNAHNLLGMTEKQAAPLFVPSKRYLTKIQPKQAALCIRRLVETGEVDWDYATTAEVD